MKEGWWCLSPKEGVSEQRPDSAAGQANRKETTQNPTLSDMTEPVFIFQEEGKKTNINKIRCSIGKGNGG